MFDLLDGSIFSLDFSASESDWLPESEPLPESLLPDWLLLLDELEEELEAEPEADPEPDSSSELLRSQQQSPRLGATTQTHPTHFCLCLNDRVTKLTAAGGPALCVCDVFRRMLRSHTWILHCCCSGSRPRCIQPW